MAFFLLHALLHLEIDCADYQFCAIWWKDTPATGLHSCLDSSKYHICAVQESRKTSACLTPVGTSGSFCGTRLCFLCLNVHCLSCLVSDGWIQSLSFLHIKESILAGLQAMLRGCCPRLVRCSFAPAHAAYKLFATTTKHREFLHPTSSCCLPAFLHPHNFWRDFRAKTATVLLRKKNTLQSWIRLQLSWFFMD